MVRGEWGLLLFLVSCSAVAPMPPVAVAKRMDAPCCPRRDTAGVAIEHGRLVVNGKALTPEFRAIESFDVSLDRREVVFSAKRENNFDIGLVSLDGSDIHWVPEDPADEINVQWAPRGNKISYVVRATGGDLVRTVHVPTAMQLSADFPYARVHSLAWDAAGDRYSVVVSSPDASERVVSLKYDGTARRTVTAPSEHLDLDVEAFGRDGVMLRPSLLHYNERLPLVVWVDDQPLEWNDARGALMKSNRVAVAVVKAMPEQIPGEQWIDPARGYLVCGPTAAGQCDRLKAAHTQWVVVPHADVESFASGWIAQHLKEPNGRR